MTIDHVTVPVRHDRLTMIFEGAPTSGGEGRSMAFELILARAAVRRRSVVAGTARVILETPYAGDVGKNVWYARAAMRDCLCRGEAPFASHLLYTQPGVLQDDVPEERERGIAAGFAWRDVAVKTVAYTDFGISVGMQRGIDHALDRGYEVEYRTLPTEVTP